MFFTTPNPTEINDFLVKSRKHLTMQFRHQQIET